MQSLAAPTHLHSTPLPSRRKLLSPTPRRSLQCHSLLSSSSSSSSSSTPKPEPLKSTFVPLFKTIAASSAAALLLHVRSISLDFGSGGGSGGFGGGGGGGGDGHGGDGGSFWRKLFAPAVANADEPQSQEWDSHGLPANIVVQLNKLSSFKKYKLSEILFFDRRRWTTVGTEDSFFEMVSLRPGGIYNKAQLQKELETLATCGMFEKVDMEGKTNPDGTIGVTISFTESTWQSADRFRCINVGLMPQSKPIEMDADMTDKEKMEYYRSLEKDYKRRIERAKPCLLPIPVHREILQMLRDQGKVSARLLQRIRDRVQKWYFDEGYACAQVVNFGNLNTKEVVCEVVEGDITETNIQFLDKLGNVVEGNTQVAVVIREMPRQLRPGNVFNIEAGKQALRNINALGLFSNIEVNPRPDEKKEGGIIVEIKLKELDQKTAEVATEWSIVPGRGGRPTLASLQPGGTVTFEHRNINGLNRSINGSVTTSNFLNPQDDLAFKLEYVHPYLDGVFDPLNRTLRVSCFNSRKLSPVFTGGPGVDEVPPIWVDRAGVKANITENFTRQSKFTYGLVMEEITTRNESSTICPNGQRVLPNGGISADGPPTTLSGTGIDQMAFLQANITRDNTKFLNGAIVGSRNVFQVDQGLGIGSKFPFFNRHQLTLTRFFQLREVEEGAGQPPPPVLVLHGHYGGCVGDLPSYDAFTLGGPYSVRGYNMGEIGAARNILELAAEIRIPVKGTHVYAFAEHGNDLGTSKDVKGNPTEVYRRLGHGSSYGVGAKLGLVRAQSLEVVCRAQGALFIEAISDSHTIIDFERAPKYVNQQRKLLSLHVADVLKGAPPLVVQLTWLRDGAAALGVGINHCLCDGIGSAEFLNSLAELASGKRGLAELKPMPVWERHLLDPLLVRPPCDNSMTHHEFNRAPDLCGFLTRFSNERLAPTSITFNKRSLNELKNLAITSSSRPMESSYTSFEVLSAHVWRSWARALNLPSNQILKILFSVNFRDRVKPSLPSGYYGNAFVLGCAQTSVKDLVEKGLGYASALVKNAKDRVDTEYVRSVAESVTESMASPDSVGVLIVSQWSRLGLDKVDFGMGRPNHVGPICCDRYCLILPVVDQRDLVKVMVAVPTSAVDKYIDLVRSPYS